MLNSRKDAIKHFSVILLMYGLFNDAVSNLKKIAQIGLE